MAPAKKNWSTEEVQTMLNIVRDKEILKLLDGKRYRGIEVYKSVEEEMKKNNYPRTAEQIRTKLKHLRKEYVECKKHNSVSGANREECAFYDLLDDIYHERPIVVTAEDGIESGSTEQESFVEDSNNNNSSDSGNTSSIEHPPKRERNSIRRILAVEEEILRKNQEWWEKEMQKQRDYEKEMLKELQKTLKETIECVVKSCSASNAQVMPSTSSGSSELQTFVSSFNPDEDNY